MSAEVVTFEFIEGDITPTPSGAFVDIGFIWPDGTVRAEPAVADIGALVGVRATFQNLASGNLSLYVHYKVTAPDATLLLEGDSGNILLAPGQTAGLDITWLIEQYGNYLAELELYADSEKVDSWSGVGAVGSSVLPAPEDTSSLMLALMMVVMMGMMMTEMGGGI